MKNYLKRTTTFFLALLMLLSVPLQAFAEVTQGEQGADPPKEEKINYDKAPIRKEDYVNKVEKLPVVPAKPGEGEKSADYIKDPKKPTLYTVRSDFKVQRGDDEIVSYQPYEATVGDDKYKYKDIDGNEKGVLTQEEKDKIKKTLVLPVLDGYTSPTPQKELEIKYEFVNDPNKTYKQKGDEKRAEHPFIYQPKESEIGVKHLFQDFNDLEKFGKKPGSTEDLITKQTGLTGTIIRVQPLPEEDRKGYVPESTNIMTQIPENNKDFIVEFRYKRAYFDVVYDTKGKHLNSKNVLEDETEYGTSIPTRRAFYEQRIPNLPETEIPTKIGSDFLGWMPSIDLRGKINNTEKTFKKGEVIKDGAGNPILDLENTIRAKDGSGKLEVDPTTKKPVYKKSSDTIELIMPGEKLTFISKWAPKPKADYAVQFWAEKADHADDAKFEEKYEFIGARVYKDKDTGSIPNLDNEPVKDIVFPDLDQKRLDKIWAGEKFYAGQFPYINKFFVYNKNLTHDENKDPKQPTMTKAVSSTGKTVYNIYYDRQVYDLYFTKSNALPAENTFYPEIYVPDGDGGAKLAGGPGNPYHYTARFNQLMLGWPNDAMQTKGFDEGKQSYGWGPNYGYPQWPLHLDTPPYRLNADEFLDMQNYDNLGGYVAQIDKGDGSTIDVKKDPRYKDEPYKALSFGIKQDRDSMPHHMDLWMDGFQPGETIIRYDLYRTKADTNSPTYGHRYPRVQGFTPYGYTEGGNWPTIEEGSEENGRITEDDIDTLNEDRGEVTPYPNVDYTDTFGFNNALGQMHFRPAFFNNADSFGDPIVGDAFKENGYLRFKYKRNKYSLRFNFDPSKTLGDSDFSATNSLKTFYEFPLIDLDPKIVARENKEIKEGTRKEKEKFKIDNPNNLLEMGLTDLVFKDSKDGNKRKVKRPDNISSDMEFKGWALDPAGTKLLWKNSKEIMPTHPLNLYAKWAEPDYQWKVTIDPDGGKMPILDNKKLATSEKTVKVGDVGQEEEKTFPVKGYKKEAPIQGDKQVFTVIHRQKLSDLINKGDPLKSIIPTKKGYEFMGWEIKRYKKDAKGDYTDELDEDYSKAYKEKYKFPEIYAFGNDVVSPIYLKAIWIKNDTIDIPSYHHFLDDKYNEPKEPMVQMLRGRRVGSYLAAVGSKQNQNRILVPKEEWGKLEGGTTSVKGSMTYSDFKKLNGDPENPRVNSYIQQIRIEPPKIKDEEESTRQGKDVYKDNPNNAFHFYYRPFRKREYKVNYIDERFKDKADEKAGAIIDQETVINGKRHFDARNFRTIPGWKLVSAPQQQLIFDINEDTNEFYGINGTGKDEITFYYKDIRIVETKSKDDPVPEGYVRVTFKADKGGSFGKDAQNNEIKEIYYDVIKGLKSDYLPVPQLLKEGETKDDKKYYITPDVGKSFKEWTDAKLLNNDTIIEKEYTFTAKFDWSGLSAKASGIVMTEAFNDPNNKWTNDFSPKLEDLKKQLVWKEKDQEKPIPAGTEIKFYDEAGSEITTNDQIFELVNEKGKADTDEVVRTVNIKVKATFKDGTGTQELTIPIKIYKNVYEALNKKGDKPLFLKEAEGKKAEEGGLQDVTGNYVRVTIAPTGDMESKDNKVYYVNPKAWVEIPEVKADGSSTFINWTADKDAQNDDGKAKGKFDFTKRHKFTEDTLITPVGADGDVVEQEDPNKKPNVPSSYVKVIVKTTDKATTETAFEKTFWVNPTKEVAIPVTNPTGKTVEADPTKPGTVGYTMNFFDWKSEETTPRTWKDKIVGKFENATTIIAKYSVEFEKIKDNEPKGAVDTPQGKIPTADEIKEKLTPPEGKTISKVTIVENPDVNTPGESKVKVIVEYNDGSSVGTNENPIEVPVKVHEPIVKANPDGSKPKDAMDNYVKVTFKAGTGGTVSGDLVYYVSPEVEVNMTDKATAVNKTPNVGYTSNGGTWSPEIKTEKIENEKTYTFNFVKSDDIVEKTPQVTEAPKGYVTVTFKTNGNGKVDGVDEKVYYVNPKVGIKLGKVAGDKILVVPTPTANDNYEFTEWQENIDETLAITGDRDYVAMFVPVEKKVTLTYEAGEGATGDVPAKVEAKAGTTVNLADQGTLVKTNAVFAGWKLDNDETIYKPGAQITLDKDRTATAQWTSTKHTVTFNTMGGSDVPSQTVSHGEKLKAVTDPKLPGKVFMGWKEQGKDKFFDLTSPINENKTLIAQWQDSVQNINDGDPVEQQFIKVTFNEGKHGKLKLADAEQTKPVTYKVAKDLKFLDAFKEGKTLPEIIADKYFKAIDQNGGWDKALELNKQDIEFTAQYEPAVDVIPIEPEKTDEDIQKEKPEGMVLVTFTVPEDKAYMLGNTKFYVKKDKVVNIETPLVRRLELGNGVRNDYVFRGWDLTQLNNEWKFSADTTISDGTKTKPTITIRIPSAGDSDVSVESMTNGSTAYLEVTRSNKTTKIKAEYDDDYGIYFFEIPNNLGGKLEKRDRIKVYAELGGLRSDTREYRVK